MGHMDHYFAWTGMPHGPAVPHDHIGSHLDEVDPIVPGELGDHPWENLWIDIGGEG